jgi:hypothetical protein
MLYRPPSRRERALRWLLSARPWVLAAEFFTVLAMLGMALLALAVAS